MLSTNPGFMLLSSSHKTHTCRGLRLEQPLIKSKSTQRFAMKQDRIEIRYMDAIAVLEEANIPYRESGKNVGRGWIGVNCPFCDDTGFHMGINIDSKCISCWKCGTTGTILKLLAAITGSFHAGLELSKRITGKILYKKENLPEENKKIKVEFPRGAVLGLQDIHKEYLKRVRRMNPQVLADKYHLYSTGSRAQLPNRIIVPVIHNYKLLTYTTISVEEKPVVRYWHCPNENSTLFIKKYLYGLETVKHRAFVVEGIFDKWRMGDETVCTFGVKPTEEQVSLLTQIQNVCIVFDGDQPGYMGAKALADKLAAFTNVQIINLPFGYDPDTLPRKSIDLIKER